MATNIENSIRVIWGLLWKLVAVVAAVYFMYRVRSILISLLVAVLLAYAMLPIVEYLCGRWNSGRCAKKKRLIATTGVFIVFVTLAVVVTGLIVTPLHSEVSGLYGKVTNYSVNFNEWLDSADKWYKDAVPQDLRKLIEQIDQKKVQERFLNYLGTVANATTSSLGMMMELILIPVLAFYFVLDYRSLSREFYGLVPKRRRKEAKRLGRDAGQIFQSYVVGQIILCTLAGLLTGLVLWSLGMPYVVVLALFAAITRAIPAVGPVISGVPIVLVGLLNFPGYGMAIALLIFIIVMHFTESKFIMPLLIGDRLHLHPAVVLIVLLVGAEFFGLIGMFLAAPIAAIGRELVRLYYIRPRDSQLAANRHHKSNMAQVP